MRQITKGSEPATLTQHRQQANADYDNYADKQGLRTRLHADQLALCCYCMRRIRNTADAMKIEHWNCQVNNTGDQLQYWNLLGACMGNQGQPHDAQHCDTYKADRALSRNPANAAHVVEATLRYMGDGRIESTDPQFDTELNQVLNLNLEYLKGNRKAVLNGFQDMLGKHGGLTDGQILGMLGDWTRATAGELHEYCGVVIYWLRKRLARA